MGESSSKGVTNTKGQVRSSKWENPVISDVTNTKGKDQYNMIDPVTVTFEKEATCQKKTNPCKVLYTVTRVTESDIRVKSYMNFIIVAYPVENGVTI